MFISKKEKNGVLGTREMHGTQWAWRQSYSRGRGGRAERMIAWIEIGNGAKLQGCCSSCCCCCCGWCFWTYVVCMQPGVC